MCAGDVPAGGIDQLGDLEAVLLFQQRRHRVGIADGRGEVPQVLVLIVPNDQRVVAAELDLRQLHVLRRRSRESAHDDRYSRDDTAQHGSPVRPRAV